jgi:D-alanyl-D-alanine carboxypeptidase
MGTLQMIKRQLITYGIIVVVLSAVYLSVSGSKAGDNEFPLVYDKPSPANADPLLNKCSTRGLALNARSVLIVDNSIDTWIYSKRPQQLRPIASLTKLLMAMVYLDMRPNLDTIVYVSNRDCYKSAKSHIYSGEGYKARDLLYAALMASDNRAARAIATASGIPRDIFVQRMNEKARFLGMMNTEAVEVTGLDERNVSTAADMAILIKAALKYPLINKITSTYTYRCKVQNKRRNKNFINTNRMVRSRWKVMNGKTGFILESDYCLATVMRDKAGKEITLVVLGSPTNNIRFQVARKLAFYGFKKAGRMGNGTQQIAGR